MTLSLQELKRNIGDNLAAARKAVDWTQQDLAEKAGLSRPTVGKIESYHTTEISVSTLCKLGNALGIPPFLLLAGKRDWESFVGLTNLAEKVSRDQPSVAETNEEQERAVRAILMPPASGQADAMETVEKAIRNPLRISDALGKHNLPNHPVLNALVAATIAIPAVDLISTHTKA